MASTESDEELATAILRYLAEHPQAMDTMDGIAQWWNIDHRWPGSTSAVVRVLDGLVQKGLVEKLGVEEPHRYSLNRRRTPR